MLPAGWSGCYFYRQLMPGQYAAKAGIPVQDDGEFSMARRVGNGYAPASIEALHQWEMGRVPSGLFLGTGDTIEDFRPYGEDDVIVFQRQAKERTVATMRKLQSQGATVVYDVDDDFSCLHPHHPAFFQYNPNNDEVVSHRNIHRAAAQADLVVVTTPALAERYGAHERVAVLPNCVPEELLGKPALADGHTIGWTGAVIVHPGDLNATRGGVAMALDGSDWRFLLLGPPDGAEHALGCGLESTGWLEISEYHQRMGELDIGIVPLADNKFNQAKSYLKGIEFAARGVPFVASELPEYIALAEEGIGQVVPSRGRNWSGALKRLMASRDTRQEMSEQGRALVAENHTYEQQGWRWIEAWEQAMSNRRLRPAA